MLNSITNCLFILNELLKMQDYVYPEQWNPKKIIKLLLRIIKPINF